MKRFALAIAAMAAFAAFGALGSVAQAATPAPGYTQFTGCPTAAEKPGVTACVRTEINGGHFKMGSKTVPISKPLVLTGGLNPGTGEISANAQGGLKPVQQQVPGGVIGLTGLDWLVNFLDIDALQLFAVTELAGHPRQTPEQTLSLPIKVRLVNPVLGNNCYVGSVTNPIKLNLTTYTTSPPPPNVPITGKEAEFSFNPEAEIFYFKNGEFVDNSFAAPGATGCTLTLFGFIPISINGLVNTQSGLPAPAGTNETRQKYNSELAPVTRVYP